MVLLPLFGDWIGERLKDWEVLLGLDDQDLWEALVGPEEAWEALQVAVASAVVLKAVESAQAEPGDRFERPMVRFEAAHVGELVEAVEESKAPERGIDPLSRDGLKSPFRSASGAPCCHWQRRRRRADTETRNLQTCDATPWN